MSVLPYLSQQKVKLGKGVTVHYSRYVVYCLTPTNTVILKEKIPDEEGVLTSQLGPFDL